MKLEEAYKLGSALVKDMQPFCERIEIAGSIRRKKASDIKDLEIVAIPKWENREPETFDGLFQISKPAPVNLLYGWAMKQESVQWIKPGVSEIVEWPVSPEGKYWRGLTRFAEGSNHIKLDLFLCTPENWGVIFLIRTGSADFSRELVTYARDCTSYRIDKGFLKQNPAHSDFDSPIPCREEADIFARLGLEYVEPERRIDGRDVIPLAGTPK